MTQNQAQTVNLQSTVNTQAQAIMDLQQRIISTEQLRHASHSEAHSHIRQIEASGFQSPAGRAPFLIDAKTLVPDNFNGEKHNICWNYLAQTSEYDGESGAANHSHDGHTHHQRGY